MPAILKKILTLIALSLSLLLNAQTDTIFWFAVPLSSRHHSVRSVDITVTATDTTQPTYVRLYKTDDLANPIKTATIDPATGLTANIHFSEGDANDYLATYSFNTLGTYEGLLLRSSSKVTSYFEFSRGYNNPDIFSLKGENALGKDFWIPFQDRWWNHDYSGNSPAEPTMSQICIIATENNTKVTITTKKNAEGFTANTPRIITLQKGETFRVVPVLDATDDNRPSRDPAKRLIGTHITSDKAIAVTIGDDSVEKNGWDYIGDQMIPVNNMKGKQLAGDEYIILRGEISEVNANNTEKAFVMCTEDNTILTIDGTDYGPYNAGHQYVINIPDGKEVTHVLSNNKPIYVFHVSGFIGEMGGAILPSITGCTGSLSVSFLRGNDSDEDIFLNMMVKSNAKDSLVLEKENGDTVHIPGSFFEPISGSDWHSLKGNNTVFDFFDNNVVSGKVTRIYNTYNVFHLGVFMETSGGCLYGYFSNYNEMESEVGIGDQGNFYLGCDIDSIRLYSSGGIRYQWSPENLVDDPTAQNPMAYPPKGTMQTFNVKITQPCFGDVTKYVTVWSNESPYAYFSLNKNHGCSEMKVVLRNGTSNNSINIDWGDGSPIFSTITHFDTISHVYKNTSDTAMMHVIQFTVNDLCPSTYSDTVWVYPQIDADMGLIDPSDQVGCAPLQVDFDNMTTGHTDRWQWDFGDGGNSFDSLPAHTFNNLGTDDTTYRVYLTAISPSPYNCTSQDFVDITVHPYINVNFGADTITKCSPFKANIKNSSSGVDLYDLDFGDGNDTTFAIFPSSIYHDYTNTTSNIRIDTLELIGRNFEGCTDTAFKPITIYPEIEADFTVSVDEICDSNWVEFTDLSHGHDFDYLWEFGDGNSTVVTSPKHLYRNTSAKDTNYIVKLTLESPYCSSEKYDTINVHNIVNAGFTYSLIEPCTPMVIEIDPRNTTGDSLYWDFDGDFVTDSIVLNHNVFQKTFYNNSPNVDISQKIRLVSSNFGCSDSLKRKLNIKPQVVPIIDNVSATSGCSPIAIDFGNQSKGGDLDYYWDFNDGNTSSDSIPLSHNFSNTSKANKAYKIVLTATHPDTKCAAKDSVTIDIYPLITAGFTQNISDICTPYNIDFVNTSTKANNESYEWVLGDGNTSNQTEFTHTYTNNTQSTAYAYPIQLKAYNSMHPACESFFYDTVKVYPKVVADLTTDISIGCNPLTVNFTNNSSAHQPIYLWSLDDLNNSSNTNPTYTFENFGISDKIFEVNLQVSDSNNCVDDTSVFITVYPDIEASFTVNYTNNCTPFVVELDNNSTKTTNESYEWNLGDGTTSAFTDISHIYQNNTKNTVLEFPVELRTYNAAHPTCEAFAYDTLWIYPKVQAVFTPNIAAGCHPISVNFSETSSGVGLNYNWDFDNGNTSGNQNPNMTFENFSKNEKSFNVKLTVTDSLSCTDDTIIQVTTYPHITSTFALSASGNCTPFPVELINNSTKATNESYKWDLGDGTTSVNTDITHVYQNNSKTTIEKFPIQLRTYLASHPECEAFSYDTLTVYPKVVASFTPDNLEGCHPFNIDFTENSNGVGLEFFWNFDTGSTSTEQNPFNSFNNFSQQNKNFDIKLTVTDELNCSDDTVVQITTHPFVNAHFSYIKLDECTPFNMKFTATNSKANTFDWDFDGDLTTDEQRSTKNTFNHLYENTAANNAITVNPTLITYYDFAPNCSDTVSAIVSIPPQVIADFIPDKTSGCQPLNISFTNNSSGGSLSYDWDFGDTTSSAALSPGHTYPNYAAIDRTFPVRLKVNAANNCSDDTTINITVYSYVESEFKLEESAKCSPFAISVTNSSRGGISSYEWDFGGQSVYNIFEPNHTFINTSGLLQNPEILLKVENTHGCSDVFSFNAKVYPQVDPNFDVDVEGCHPFSVTFENNTSYARDYKWTFGDGSTSIEKEPKHTFNNFDRRLDSTYNINLTAYSIYECMSSKDTIITVYPKPIALYDASNSVGCPPFDVSFTNHSIGKQLIYDWDFGDGTDEATTSPEHIFDNDDTEIVQYKVVLYSTTEDGCIDTVSKEIRVYPKVTSEFSIDVENGCSPLIVNFTNKSKNFDYVEWDFDNGLFSSVVNPEHRFVNVQKEDHTFNVKLTSRSDYNCFAEITKNIIVFPKPSVEFSIEPTHQIYEPEPDVYLTNWSDNIDTWKFTWDFGDGSTSNESSQNFSKEYTIWGDIENDSEIPITLLAENPDHPECAAQTTHKIRIIPPEPQIDIEGDATVGCVPYEVDFTTLYKYVHPDGFSWDFDDGSSSKQSAPIHVFNNPGIYNVKLEVVGDGGKNYDYITVTVNQLPEVDFTVYPTDLLLPAMDEPSDTLKTYNLTKYGESYEWFFGDGTSSNDFEPNHVYEQSKLTDPPYSFDIKLIATTEFGCIDSIRKENHVNIEGSGAIRFPNAFTPNPDGPSDGRYSLDYPDNSVFHPHSDGVLEYHLEIYTRWGEMIFSTDSKDIGWNGYYKDKLVSQGVYIWKVWGRFTNNREFVKYGDVTVLHNSNDIIE